MSISAMKWILVLPLAAAFAGGCASHRNVPSTREGRIPVVGGEVWYRIVGAERRGVPLLVLHGGPGVPHDYMEPLSAFADARPVIFYDQLGCGNSDRPTDQSLWTIDRFVDELARVRAALKLDRVHILGHSWGTIVATEYMLNKKPEGVVSLTLAGPALNVKRWVADQRVWMMELPESAQAAIREAEAANRFDAPEFLAATHAFYARHVCRLDPWPDFVQRALSPEKMGIEVYLFMNGPSEFMVTGVIKTYDAVDRLKEIKTPTLFISGRYDEATPAATEFYHRSLPGSRFEVIEDASHLPFVEQPEAFNHAVRRFLKQAEAEEVH